ncbi:MAG: Wzz/FepE/Etk N-terminal domain-containing protein, partial [Acidimicrobiales bacterium]
MLPTEQANDVAELELRDYLSVIWRRRRVVILCLIVTVGAAIAYSVSRPAVYRADAELLLETRVLDPLGENSRPADAERLLNNEIRVIESSAVVDAVDDAYDGPLDPDDLNAGIASSTSDAIKLSITGRDPEATADLVNVYADTYVEYRLAQQVGELLAAGAEIQPQIDELHQRIAATRAPLTALEAEIAAIDPESRGAADAVADLEARHDQLASELQPQLAPLQNQLSFYQQQLDELEVSAGVTQRGGPKILQRATVPESPVSPRPTRDAVIAAFLGLLLGLGLAFLVDHLDLSLKTKEDVETVARDVPTLGLIPRMEDWKNESEARLARRGTGASEAYRALRTSVKFAGLERKLNVIQVTSPGANEGKTTTLANLAVVLAEAGDRVCVVCCDLRHPRIQDFFHAELAPGFTSALLGDIELELVVQRLLDNNRLYLLPAGPKAPNPSELLSLNRAE